MEPAVIIAIIGAAQAITVAALGGIFAHLTKKAEMKAEANREADLKYRKEREERDKLREERDEAIYNLVLAEASGTEVLLHKAHGDQTNGEVDDALSSIRSAKSAYNKLANKNMAHI